MVLGISPIRSFHFSFKFFNRSCLIPLSNWKTNMFRNQTIYVYHQTVKFLRSALVSKLDILDFLTLYKRQYSGSKIKNRPVLKVSHVVNCLIIFMQKQAFIPAPSCTYIRLNSIFISTKRTLRAGKLFGNLFFPE